MNTWFLAYGLDGAVHLAKGLGHATSYDGRWALNVAVHMRCMIREPSGTRP